MKVLWSVEKQYWSMAQLAAIINESDTTIRLYCRLFHVYPKRGKNGFIQFSLAEKVLISEISRLMVQEKRNVENVKQKLGIL